MKNDNSQQLLKSVGKAIDVLYAFLEGPNSKTLGEISQKIGLGKSTTHRLLGTLKEKGLIEQEAKTGYYKLGLKLLHLSSLVLANIDMRDLARPHLEELSKLVSESVHIALLSGWEAVFVDKVQVPASFGVRMTSFVGRVVPLYCTSVGKILLSSQGNDYLEQYLATFNLASFTPNTITQKEELLEELRVTNLRGYSIDRGEYTEGLMCLGAGIGSAESPTKLAISISGPLSHLEGKESNLEPYLRTSAQNISRDLIASGLELDSF